MKKLLCIVGGMNAGGAETFLMKIFRNLDKEKYQMDFCVSSREKGFYDDEIKENGGKIFYITKKSNNPIKSFRNITAIVKNGKYNNVIRISQHSLSSIDLLAAKKGGAKNLIFRSSNSNSCGNIVNRLLHIIFKPLAKIVPTVMIAPSDKAAIHMFGKKKYKNGEVLILKNGLEIDDYKYNEEVRNKIRKKYNIADKFVIGHVGRFTKQKNHQFLLSIFDMYHSKVNKNSVLILIGAGKLEKDIRGIVDKKGMNNSVIFLGAKHNTNEFYQAFDYFLFPSLFEGMPNTVIEAQCSGLNCLISDNITKEVVLTNLVTFESLCNDSKKWASKIKASVNRKDAYKFIAKNGYDIKNITSEFVTNCIK